MRLSLFLPALAFAFSAFSAHASKTVLPAFCGADNVAFDVNTQRDAPAPGGPAEGKARIVFIETFNRPTASDPFGGPDVPDFTTRFGVDGAWVGATRFNSYFTVELAPGQHRFCVSVRGHNDLIGTNFLTVEAGNTYYMEYEILPSISHEYVSTPARGENVYGISVSSTFKMLTDENGKSRVKACALSVSRRKK